MEKNTALEALAKAAADLEKAQAAVTKAAVEARDFTGASWAEIAAPLGMTRQAAQQKYGKITRDKSRDHLYTDAENREADAALAALQAVAAKQDEQDEYGTRPEVITGITVGPPHVKEWPAEVRRKPSKKVDAPAPAKPAMAKGMSKKGKTPALDSMTGDPRPIFKLQSAGRIDGVAQPGTGKGPHACPRCECTNHKGDENQVRAYFDCSPTKYDPQDIADYLNSTGLHTKAK